MISRSKSAPRTLDDLAFPTRPVKLIRSHTAVSITGPNAATPWEPREDPFSLAGFFPSRLAESQEDWDWTRSREEGSYEDGDEDEDGTGVLYDDILRHSTWSQRELEDSYDEFARQIIHSEDKFGMLAFSSENFPTLLRSKVPTFERPASPVHISPLVVDEPSDLDALHSRLCSRRETLVDGEAERGAEIGQLFFSIEDEKQKNTDSWFWPWTKLMYTQLMGLVGKQLGGA